MYKKKKKKKNIFVIKFHKKALNYETYRKIVPINFRSCKKPWTGRAAAGLALP